MTNKVLLRNFCLYLFVSINEREKKKHHKRPHFPRVEICLTVALSYFRSFSMANRFLILTSSFFFFFFRREGERCHHVLMASELKLSSTVYLFGVRHSTLCFTRCRRCCSHALRNTIV